MNLLAKKFDIKYIFSYLIIIDLLFLPYFQGIIIPYSLPAILFCLVYFNISINKDLNYLLLSIIALSVLISLIISFILPDRDSWHFENIKRAIQLLSSFSYFFYFKWISEREKINIYLISLIFILWFNFLGILFFLDPVFSKELIRTFYGRLVDPEGTIHLSLRFSYIFTDPNTAAYFYLIALAPLFIRYQYSNKNLYETLIFFLFSLMASFGLVITQSLGGIISFILMILFAILPTSNFIRSIFSIKFLVILFIFFSFIILVLITLINFASDSEIFMRLLTKMLDENNDHYVEYRQSGGNRFIIWRMTLDYFGIPFPFGRGAVLLMDGDLWGPHSDLIHYLYSYGLIGVICVSIFLFRHFPKYLVLCIPAFIAYMINSLVGDQKVLALYLSLLGLYVGSSSSLTNKNYKNI